MIDINLEKQLPVVTMNFDEVKASLSETIEKYKNIVVTEDGLKDCKATQKELAGIRIKLDSYRKEIKKEMSKPIEAFENQCKELITLVTNAEVPIKEGIEVFDQKKKEANKQIALDMISEAITEHGLNEKYAKQVNVLDKYCNLTAKPNDVKTDIDQRCILLLQEQNKEIEMLQIMNDTIENCNKNIDAKMSIADFQSLIDMNASPVKIMSEIQSRAERIKQAELKAIADKEAKAERERLAEEERIRIASLSKEETPKQSVSLPVDLRSEPVFTEPVTIATPIKEEPIYFVEMRVVGTLDVIKELSQFLKNNNYNYTKLKDGKFGK